VTDIIQFKINKTGEVVENVIRLIKYKKSPGPGSINLGLIIWT
jgi:hypothetical protein